MANLHLNKVEREDDDVASEEAVTILEWIATAEDVDWVWAQECNEPYNELKAQAMEATGTSHPHEEIEYLGYAIEAIVADRWGGEK